MAAADDAAEAGWFAVDALPDLAFDHPHVIDWALHRLRIAMDIEGKTDCGHR